MRANQEIRPLTGLRGIAALYVLVFHYFPLTAGIEGRGPAARFMSHGYLAVDLFFVLSGFVMALTYARDFLGGFSGRAYLRFLGRRIARIYPLYLCTAVAGFVLVSAHWLPYDHVVPRIVAAAANLLMVQAWGIAPSFDSPAWSISAEWAAYLVFPVLLLPALFAPARIRWLTVVVSLGIIVALGALPAAFKPEYLQRDPLNFNGYWLGFPVLRCIPEFALGIAAFGAARSVMGTKIGASRWVAPLVCLALAALLTIPRSDVAIVALLPLLILSLTTERHLPGRILASPLFELAGKLSFSIYLIHKLLIGIVGALGDGGRAAGVPHAQLLAGVLCFGLTIVLAFAAYRWIELPGRRLLRALLEPAVPTPSGETPDDYRPPVAVQA